MLAHSIKAIPQKLKNQVKKIVRQMPFLPQQWTKFDLLKTLVQRDLESRYKGSILGNLWPFLNQLAQLLVYTYVFSIVLQVKLSLKGLPTNSFTFGLWLFAGLIPWVAFTTGLVLSAQAVIGQPNLVKKVVFPLALLPLVPIVSAFVESSFGLMLLITFVAFTTQTIPLTLVLLPLVWIPQLLFTAGLSYLAAGLTVFLRDIPQLLGVAVNLWFYITPIIYPVTAIPEAFRFWVIWFNPMSIVVQLYRDLVLVGQVEHSLEWGILWVVSSLTFAIGFWVYQRLRSAFADVL